MNRRTMLKSTGLASIAILLPLGKNSSANAGPATATDALQPAVDCVLIPAETAGPYPWPSDGQTLSTDATFFRQDMTEDRAGLPLTLTLTIVNINDSCAPVLNAAVVAWHCDKDGNYSEFGNSVGKSFLRGIQMTDASGQVTFKTIYPGWYPGRTTHIHFQVFLSSHVSATSQLAFPESANSAVYSLAPYSSRGQKDTSNTADGIFSDSQNTQYQMATMSGDAASGLTASLTVGINAPTSGVINLEPETGGQFKLRQNFPNPVTADTRIPFTLTNDSQVRIELFDTNGKKVSDVFSGHLNAGDQEIRFDPTQISTRLAAGGYIYQLTVENAKGLYRQCKMMTIV